MNRRQTQQQRLALARRRQSRPRALEPGEAAWIGLLPCALLVLAAIVLLGPPLGETFLGPGSERFFPRIEVAPEPVEHARYIIALLGAPLLAAVVLLAVRRSIALPARTARVMQDVAQAALFGFLVLCLLALNDVIFTSYRPPSGPNPIFGVSALLAAAALPLLALAGLRANGVAARLAALARETPRRRWTCLFVAILLTATWLLPAVNTETSIANAHGNNLIPWDMDETFAILDGRTPLHDYHAMYAQLWPYVAASVLALVGSPTVGVWTVVMTTVTVEEG